MHCFSDIEYIGVTVFLTKKKLNKNYYIKETENKMTNFEKYKDEILRIATESNEAPAMEDGMLTACRSLSCKECDFNEDNCVTSFFNWLYENDGEQEFTCSSCKYASKDEKEYPCSECSRGYTDLFELKPKKTRQSEFLKLFPNASVTHSGLLGVKPCTFEGRNFIKQKCDLYATCLDCQKDYWFQEVEE